MKMLYVSRFLFYIVRQMGISTVMVFLFSLQLYANLPEQADENQSLITDANQAYSDGNFEDAISLYEQVLEHDYEAPQLYYNLGNSYFKSNNLPAAILNYERAKRLAANDEDIAFNLKLANLKTPDKIESIPTLFFKTWWNSFARLFSGKQWAIISIVSFWICILMFCVYITTNKVDNKKIFFWFSALLLLLTIFSFTYAYQGYKAVNSNNEAIIFSASVTIKSSPDENGTDLFVLHEGTKVMILDGIGEWNKIKLSDGSVGWIRSEAVETI